MQMHSWYTDSNLKLITYFGISYVKEEKFHRFESS